MENEDYWQTWLDNTRTMYNNESSIAAHLHWYGFHNEQQKLIPHM